MILIVDCYLDEGGGTTNFARQLGGRSWESIRPTREALPSIKDWSAVIITGSGACLADGNEGEGVREGWTQELIVWTKKLVEAGIPLLGVCFGHQIIGAAFGGGVRKALVPEVGFKKIRIHTADSLFVGLQP
jgi:GMP synthase (glutamine-hydrolysing)